MPVQFLQSSIDASPIRIPAIGLDLFVRVPSATTDNAVSVIETVNAPGYGPPLHRHPQAELFRVLEGTYLYEVDGRRFTVSAGDVVTIPGGAAHAFVNVTDRPARQYVIILPALDAAGFFTGLGDIMRHGRPDTATLNAFGRSWDVEFLGPPLKP